MLAAAILQPSPLDVPTLAFVATCIATLLGVCLILAWLQQRDARALAWWGTAYLVGASSMVFWSAPSGLFVIPQDLPAALIFVACGMIWNGMRLFHGRRVLPVAIFAGAVVWLVLCQVPALASGSIAHMALGAVVVGGYTFFIAFEFWRERRHALYSRTAAVIVTALHAGIFVVPLALRAFMPALFATDWLTVFALVAIIYTIGTAFIMLLMVKDHHVYIYRKAATIDSLTGLLNRGAFMQCAITMCDLQCHRGKPVTLMVFDLDHFKSVNDRFGHAAGDSVLRVFAAVARDSMRASDIIGRLGGEEFAAIVPEPMEGAMTIAERLRVAFEAARVTVGEHAIGATVSIGAATSYDLVTDIDALIARADGALYSAKHAGRNRICTAENASARSLGVGDLVVAAGRGRTAKRGLAIPRKAASRRPNDDAPGVLREAETSRLPYSG
jgi:diguanylate cyclase (GGDEF)-like protein